MPNRNQQTLYNMGNSQQIVAGQVSAGAKHWKINVSVYFLTEQCSNVPFSFFLILQHYGMLPNFVMVSIKIVS